MGFHSLHVFMHLADFLALFGLSGLTVARVWLIPHSAFAKPDFCLRWRRLLGGCLLALALTGAAILLIRTAEMSGNSFAGSFSSLPAVLRHTHFGIVWSLHLAVLVVLVALWAVPANRFPGTAWPPVLILGVLVLAFSYSASSHAAGQGDFTLAELNDWLHLIATSTWGGGVLAAVFLVLPVWREQHSLISQVLLRLSNVSAVAMAVVLVTGLYSTVLRLHRLSELGIGDYGRALSAKLVLVGFLILVGALSRFFIIPCIVRYPASSGRFIRQLGYALVVNVVLVVLVLLASAVLVQGMPPRVSAL